MIPALRNQLAHLDRALLALVDERARLLAAVPGDDPGRAAAVDDLRRRHQGGFASELLAELYALIDRGCAGAAPERRP